MSDERYRVQSLGRAFDMLDRLAEAGREGMRLTDLAKDTGMSKAATYATLATLRARGVVATLGDGPTRRYRLGLALAGYGDLVLANTGLADVALPVLREITEALDLTSRAAVLDEDGYAVVVARVDAPGAVRFNAALGRRELPHCSAVGKVLLAALPWERTQEILGTTGLPRRTAHTITTMEAMRAEIARTVRDGYAVDDEEDCEGVFCVAVGIRGRGGELVGAVSVTGLTQQIEKRTVAAIVPVLAEHAARISAALGA